MVLISVSCSQVTMSDEQREQLKNEKSARKIQRLTDADILNAAQAKAVEVYKLSQSNKNTPYQVKWVTLRDSSSNRYEQQMQEAYQYALDNRLELHDNIEDLGDGNIAFTKPDTQSDSMKGFWVILLDKKEVIKELQ